MWPEKTCKASDSTRPGELCSPNTRGQHPEQRGGDIQLRFEWITYYGPEFISTAIADWAEEHDIDLVFIQPGNPTQNSYVERFDQTYRDEILNLYVLKALNEVGELTDNRVREYNEERPRDSQEDLTPNEYLSKHDPSKT